MSSISIAEKQEELVSLFSMISDWQERYRAIIELGRELPPYPELHRRVENKVKGCQSQVWLHADFNDGLVELAADSDATIVRGLIALILRVYSGHTPEEILSTPPHFIDHLGLSKHLSHSRANGLSAMIKKVQYYATVFNQVAG